MVKLSRGSDLPGAVHSSAQAKPTPPRTAESHMTLAPDDPQRRVLEAEFHCAHRHVMDTYKLPRFGGSGTIAMMLLSQGWHPTCTHVVMGTSRRLHWFPDYAVTARRARKSFDLWLDEDSHLPICVIHGFIAFRAWFPDEARPDDVPRIPDEVDVILSRLLLNYSP